MEVHVSFTFLDANLALAVGVLVDKLEPLDRPR